MTLRATRRTVRPTTTPNGEYVKGKSIAATVYETLTLRALTLCDCGQPARHIAIFQQLTSTQQCMRNGLALCPDCANDFDGAEKIYTLQEAYEIANVKTPQWFVSQTAHRHADDRDGQRPRVSRRRAA